MTQNDYRFKICDPIHSFIRYDEIEEKVIDSLPFQRLRYIRQMGVAYLIYPGAIHTRFEHSLGVMEIASRIYDSLMRTYNLHPVSQGRVPLEEDERFYWRRILRIAALCHDMGHLPFSHTAEKFLLTQGGHEVKTREIIQSHYLRPLWKEISSERNVEEDILKLSVGFETMTPWERVLSQVITDNNFGADRIDYLIRDATFTGVGYGHFDYHQLIDCLRLLPEGTGLTLGLAESGVQSVESLWIARYLMYARVYHHKKARIYTEHMRAFMRRHYAAVGFPKTVEAYLQETDYIILTAAQKAAKEGDRDAAALLKQVPAFATIEEEKQKKTPNARLFLVIKPEGTITPSEEISPFLRDIPLE